MTDDIKVEAPGTADKAKLTVAVLIVAAALFVSPLGYFAIPYLGALADNAASALF